MGVGIALILRAQSPSAAEPKRPAAIARTLGVGGSYSNHTVLNTLPGGLDATGWTYRLYKISAGQVLEAYNGVDNPFTTDASDMPVTAAYAVPICPPADTCNDTIIAWNNAATGRVVGSNEQAHFGYKLAPNYQSNEVKGKWTGVDSTGATVEATIEASTLAQWLTPAFTPSPTPTRTPRLPLEIVPAISLPFAAQQDSDSEPPSVLARIQNLSMEEVIVERFYKLVPKGVGIKLEDLTRDAVSVEGEKQTVQGRIVLRPLEYLDLQIEGLSNRTQDGVVFWYTAERRGSETVAYEAYHALELTVGDSPTSEVPPTPTPTRPTCYLPHVLREHPLRPTVSPPARP